MGTPRSEIVPGRCNAPERVSELTAALPSCLPDCGTALGACDSFLPALGTAGWCWELPIGVRLRGFGGKWVRNLVISGCGTCRTPELFRCQLQRCGVASLTAGRPWVPLETSKLAGGLQTACTVWGLPVCTAPAKFRWKIGTESRNIRWWHLPHSQVVSVPTAALWSC